MCSVGKIKNLVKKNRLEFIGVLLGGLFISSQSVATHDDLVHFSAHFGMSYSINTITYGVCSNVFKMNKNSAILTANVITLLIGVSYKLLEAQTTGLPSNFAKSMAQNALGVGVSNLTIISFDFGSK